MESDCGKSELGREIRKSDLGSGPRQYSACQS